MIDISNRVTNTDRRFGSAQMVDAMDRAAANPEDITPPTRWQRIKAWFRV